ncbi:uncharacterized protein EI97DRAFT_466573 [Westerdykella ornata]|uniref:Uncharacterized protein n=1 Tax=Westerdykella ornata TaxID=318751 RepID=A0A6A6JM44_WESOR|nr:uncharacterized protein EI97DRAFT_466573 [Westerdykella ornata]KAF2277018.1 hypothetical protein EI97DRAFT_466573 [Westerdykella ornata]
MAPISLLLLPTLLAVRSVEAASKKVLVNVWNHEYDCSGIADKVKEVNLDHCSKKDVYGRSVLLRAPAKPENYDSWSADADHDYFVSLYTDKKCKHFLANITVPSGLEKCWCIPAGHFARGFKFRSEKRETSSTTVAAQAASTTSKQHKYTSIRSPVKSSTTVTAPVRSTTKMVAQARSNITFTTQVTHHTTVVPPVVSDTPVIRSNVTEIVVPAVVNQTVMEMAKLTAILSHITVVDDTVASVTVWDEAAGPGSTLQAVVSDITVVENTVIPVTVWEVPETTITVGKAARPSERAEIPAEPMVESRAAFKKYEVSYLWYNHPWEMTPVCFKCWLEDEHGREFECEASRKTNGLCGELPFEPPTTTAVAVASSTVTKTQYYVPVVTVTSSAAGNKLEARTTHKKRVTLTHPHIADEVVCAKAKWKHAGEENAKIEIEGPKDCRGTEEYIASV